MSAAENKPQKATVKDASREKPIFKELNSTDLVQIEQELKEFDPKIFDGIKAEKKKEILTSVTRLSIIQKSHSGPIPDPETLAHYNQVIPNAADRILIMAEKQQEHRMKLEEKAVTAQLSQSARGQIIALIVCILALSVSTYLAMNNHETVATIIAGITVTLVGVFALGKMFKRSPEK